MEDSDDESSFLTPKQRKLLSKVMRNLAFYFGLYLLTKELDKHIQPLDMEKAQLVPAFIAINIAFLIQMVYNYFSRQEIREMNRGLDDASSGGILGSSALATIFNAVTQTTTTVCANGQCFTIYSNTIASNMAAFGVSVTSINTYLVPLCCLLLAYSMWSLYKEKRSCTYKPFLMGVFGSTLIILDNFVLGDKLKLHNIPSWIGNGCLIGSAIWAARDQSAEK